MKTRFVVSVLVVALAVACVPISPIQPTPTDPLRAMLALVPATDGAFSPNGVGPSYVDYHAIATAMGVKIPPNDAAFQAMGKDQQAQWLWASWRIAAGPSELVQAFSSVLVGAMSSTVGFDWFAIDRALVYGEPPETSTILAVQYDAAKVGQVLQARQFERKEVQGVTVWYRFEDGAVSLKDRNPADPFGGRLGAAARVALLPGGIIANSRFWGRVENIIGVVKDQRPSLAGNDDFRVLAEAVTDANRYHGALLQANFFAPQVFAYTTVDPRHQMSNPPDLSQYGPLPCYSLVALVDRQEGDRQVNLIAAVYPAADTATRAGLELQKRLANFDPPGTFAQNKVTVDKPHVYQDSQTGLAVAIASIRYPLPPIPTGSDSAQAPRPGLEYHMWMQALFAREFFPLDPLLPAPQ